MYGKEKTCGPAILLESYISVYSESNVKLHTGWSIFLFHLSENKCSEQILENFRNGKIFRRQNFFVGIIRR